MYINKPSVTKVEAADKGFVRNCQSFPDNSLKFGDVS